MLSDCRHVAKVWEAAYSQPWNILLLRLHFALVGHMIRSQSELVSGSVGLLEVLTESSRMGLRRCRTGPDWSGVKRVAAFVRAQHGTLSDAFDKEKWRGWEDLWIASFGLTSTPGPCVLRSHPLRNMWHYKCLQGCLHGSQTFYWVSGDGDGPGLVLELRRAEGWVKVPIMGNHRDHVHSQFFSATLKLLRSFTVHLRVFPPLKFGTLF